MKKLLVFVLSAVMAVCMCGFAVTAFAEGDPVALGLPAALGADENYFTAEVSPSLYTEEGVIEYDIAGAPLSSVILSDGSKTASVTHFRNEPAMGRMKFYDTNGFMNFKTAAKGSTITFKANATFTDRGTTYTFGDKDVVYECDGNGGWTKKAAEKVTLSPVAIAADENMFRLTVSPSLYTAEGVSEYDIPGASLSSVILSDGSKTASVTHFRNEPAMGCMKFYDTNGFMNFKTAAKGATITLKGNTTFIDHDAVYTFGEEDIVFVCDGNGVWTKQTEEEPVEELWTTDVLSDGTLNVPSYEGNSVKFDGDKISVNLFKATAPNTDAYDISASFNRVYKGDFTLSFRFSYLSHDHTGDRFFIFSAGDYSFLYCPYWGDGDASLLAGTNYSSDGAGRIAKTNPGSEFTVKFVRNGDVLSLFINGELLGSASGITADKTQFTMKARRVICELSGIRGSGDVAAPVKSWTSEDFAAAAIDVPEFENNSVSTANDKLTFDLSANAGATDFTKEATVSFDKEYTGDFAIGYTLNYLSVSNTGVRYLMFTIGDSYAMMYCPYNADVQLLQSTTYDTKRVASMFFSANEGTFRVVRSGNELSFYVNGNKLGDTQVYASEKAKFGFKAHRVTAEISDFKAEGEVKEEPVIPVDPDAGKTFVNWGASDFADSVKNVPEYDGNFIAAEEDKLTISLSKNTAADSADYDSSVTFGKVYEGDFTLEFTLNYLSADHTGLRYVMFTAGGYGIAYCPYCEKIHFYRGEEYHGDGLIEEPEFKGVTQFRFRIVAENGKLNVKVNDTAFTEQDYTETETSFGFKARRTISGISDWKIAGSVKTAGNVVSTDVFRFITATGAEMPTFAINRNLGSVAFATENADLSAVKYIPANGQKVSVTSVNYSVSAAGDGIILLKGLTVYEMNEANYNNDMGMVRLDESYAPVFVLGENLIYRYDGANFVKAPAAMSASIVNEEEILSLRAGTTAKILWSVNEGAVDYPKFYSDNENVATVDQEGNVSALTQGDVTFKLVFAGITKTIAVTVGAEPAKTGIRYELATSAQRDGKAYFVAYVGETLDLDRLTTNLSAYWIMEDGVAGTEFAVTKDMIDASMFNNSVAGETKVVLKNEDFSVDVLVYVYEVETVENVNPSRIVSFGSAVDVYFIDSVGGSETSDVKSFNIIENPLYGIPTNIVTLRKAALDGAVEYALHSVGQVSNLQCILFFNEFDMSAKSSIPVGAVLSFNKNFRFWRYTDGTWIAAYKFKNDVSYVWTGTEWTWFEADAVEVTTLETSLTLPVGAEYAPEYSVLPENSYYVPSLESSEPKVATIENGKIRAVGEGSATISLKFGSRKCTIALSVVKKEIVGVKLADERVYNLSVGGSLDLSKISVYADYGDGIYGEAFALTDDNASYELDTSAAGKQTIEMTVYVGDKPFKLEISVAVWNVEEVYPDNIACYDDAGWFMGTTIGIFFRKTFGNMANVYPYDLPGDEGKFMTDYVTYTRAGETVECDSQAYLTYIFTVTPKIGGKGIETYLVGDTITLKKGMGFYKWFGETDANNVPQGAGDYVKVGELKYDMTFTYNENKKFFLEIPVADAKVLEETVSVGMGETHATNVVAIPSYCSNAEWFFAVSDPSVASVSAQGLIKGLKIGSTTVKATLKTIAGDTIKELTYTVSVTDSVSGILITSEKAVELTKGEKFDFASVKDRFGVKAIVLMVSGATGKEVDLTGARITGYDPDRTGEQTVTFRITVDGKSVTGELKVTVKEEKSGCGSSVDYGMFVLIAFLPLAVITVKKKGEIYAD